MSRLLPHPILSLSLVALWLILQQSVSTGQILLGLVIGIVAGLATRRLGLQKPVVHRPWLIPELVLVVTIDIVRSNLAVLWIILTGGTSPKTANFVRVPIQLRDRTALAFLAVIVTATPGTIWLEFDEEAGELLLHVLDVYDEAAWIDIIGNRYQGRLLEIFT